MLGVHSMTSDDIIKITNKNSNIDLVYKHLSLGVCITLSDIHLSLHLLLLIYLYIQYKRINIHPTHSN